MDSWLRQRIRVTRGELCGLGVFVTAWALGDWIDNTVRGFLVIGAVVLMWRYREGRSARDHREG